MFAAKQTARTAGVTHHSIIGMHLSLRSSVAERVLRKDEVGSSILPEGIKLFSVGK